ncbi:MAG: flagellar FlbD family protein [Anaerolineaceae bacterium]|nr:flagellar FlbD family protein [Anaerolineaceae bacterium]
MTRFNGSSFYVNADLIQTVEQTPDTVITLTDDKKLIVKEPVQTIVDRFIEYQQKIRLPFQQEFENKK